MKRFKNIVRVGLLLLTISYYFKAQYDFAMLAGSVLFADCAEFVSEKYRRYYGILAIGLILIAIGFIIMAQVPL